MDESRWGSVIRSMTTSSAVNPALVIAVVCIVIGVPALALAPPAAATVISFVVVAPLCLLLLQLGFFTIVDRDRLQNDRHVEQKMLITKTIGYMKDGKPEQVQLPASEALVDNPTSKAGDAL